MFLLQNIHEDEAAVQGLTSYFEQPVCLYAQWEAKSMWNLLVQHPNNILEVAVLQFLKKNIGCFGLCTPHTDEKQFNQGIYGGRFDNCHRQ